MAVFDVPNLALCSNRRHLYIPFPHILHPFLPSVLLLLPPNQPRRDHHALQPDRRPQRRRHPGPTIRKHPAHHRPRQQQHHRHHPPIPLRVPPQIRQHKHLRIREQVTVRARQHHARQPVELKHSTRHRLAATLEREHRERDQDPPGLPAVGFPVL